VILSLVKPSRVFALTILASAFSAQASASTVDLVWKKNRSSDLEVTADELKAGEKLLLDVVLRLDAEGIRELELSFDFDTEGMNALDLAENPVAAYKAGERSPVYQLPLAPRTGKGAVFERMSSGISRTESEVGSAGRISGFGVKFRAAKGPGPISLKNSTVTLGSLAVVWRGDGEAQIVPRMTGTAMPLTEDGAQQATLQFGKASILIREKNAVSTTEGSGESATTCITMSLVVAGVALLLALFKLRAHRSPG